MSKGGDALRAERRREQEKRVLGLVAGAGQITVAEVAKALFSSDADARAVLDQMTARGDLRQVWIAGRP